MQFLARERAAAVRLLLLLCFAPLGAFCQFEIAGSQLLHEGEPFLVRGVVYANAPIGAPGQATLGASSCLYPRDFPLIAGLGANTIRTRERVSPADRVFRRSLASAGLYWIAGFPVAPYLGSGGSLDAAALRVRILDDLSAYAEAWADEPRLLAVSIDGVEEQAFYELLAEAAARLRAERPQVLLTSSVPSAREIGAFDRSTQDVQQPDLDFWSLDLSGRAELSSALAEASGKTAKPILVSGFGVDAFDAIVSAADLDAQARYAELLAEELNAVVRAGAYRALGSVYAELSDQWHLGGPDPNVHGAGGRQEEASPDGFFNAAWAGLFGLTRSGAPGLDSLRPRPAYHALAGVWEGFAPPELSAAEPPSISAEGVRNAASGAAVLAPGALLEVAGESLASATRQTLTPADLPFHLGAVSLCFDGAASPLYLAEPELLRGVVPWSARTGVGQAVVFRAGAASMPVAAEARPAAPGILPGGVLRPGLPCPVNEANGVPPGAYLEIYGSGLGAPAAPQRDGVGAAAPVEAAEAPSASFAGFAIPVLYSGLLPGAPGVYQTNVRIPEEAGAGPGALRLRSAGAGSNSHPIRVLGQQDAPGLALAPLPADEIVVQEGGPAQTVHLKLEGRNGFCSLVRFVVSGLPPGVKASIPVGLPGQRIPLTVWAEPGAARAQGAEVTVAAVSTLPQSPTRALRVTVLPGSGDIRLRVVSGGWLSGTPQASFVLEDRVLHRAHGGGPGRGFNFVTIHPQSGTVGPVRHFDTWASDEAVTAMESFLRGLPQGLLVLGAIADDGVLNISDQTRAILRESLGASQIDSVQYQWSWAIIARVGAERPMAEGATRDQAVTLDRTLSFPLP